MLDPLRRKTNKDRMFERRLTLTEIVKHVQFFAKVNFNCKTFFTHLNLRVSVTLRSSGNPLKHQMHPQKARRSQVYNVNVTT